MQAIIPHLPSYQGDFINDTPDPVLSIIFTYCPFEQLEEWFNGSCDLPSSCHALRERVVRIIQLPQSLNSLATRFFHSPACMERINNNGGYPHVLFRSISNKLQYAFERYRNRQQECRRTTPTPTWTVLSAEFHCQRRVIQRLLEGFRSPGTSYAPCLNLNFVFHRLSDRRQAAIATILPDLISNLLPSMTQVEIDEISLKYIQHGNLNDSLNALRAQLLQKLGYYISFNCLDILMCSLSLQSDSSAFVRTGIPFYNRMLERGLHSGFFRVEFFALNQPAVAWEIIKQFPISYAHEEICSNSGSFD